MASVAKVRGRYCVTHDVTGAVLKRKGRAVCFASKKAAGKEARATRRRVMAGR